MFDGEVAKQERQFSKVAFPYAGLDEAMVVVKAIQQGGGLGLDRDQLAARLDQKVSSGSFVAKVSAAKMFGLVDTSAASSVRLTSLGHEALSNVELRRQAAFATAFLNVELFKKLYDEFRGRSLPPRPNGLEAALVQLGVSEKQRRNARYALDRSAKAAGFYEHGQDRLVAPVTGVATSKQDDPSETPATPARTERSTEPGAASAALDGVISALIARLPGAGPWPADDRVVWLTMMAMAFDLAYGRDGQIGIINTPANGNPAPTYHKAV